MIESAIIRLIRGSGEFNGTLKDNAGRQFFAELLMKMKRIITTDVPTLGVNVTDSINLYINPHFWESLSESQQVSILCHEVGHVIYDHFSRFRDIHPDFDKKSKESAVDMIKFYKEFSILNQAGDYAINDEEWVKKDLPKKIGLFDKEGKKVGEGEPCTVEGLQKMLPKVKVKHKQTMEYYYNLIKEDQQKNGGQGEGGGQIYMLDDHSIWAEGHENEEYVKEIIKRTVKSAAEEAAQKAGSLPGELQLIIDNLNRKPKNWKGDLRKFFANTSEIVKELSKRVRNRRYGVLYPGSKNYCKLNIGVAVDTSGSVSDEYIEQFFAEINAIHNEQVRVTIIEFDAQVNQVYEFNPKKKVAVKGRGGTCFSEPMKTASEMELDGIIFLTDGYCFDKPEKPKNMPVMWAIIEGGKQPFSWGYFTKISLQENKNASKV